MTLTAQQWIRTSNLGAAGAAFGSWVESRSEARERLTLQQWKALYETFLQTPVR